jgi:tight adherence protein B
MGRLKIALFLLAAVLAVVVPTSANAVRQTEIRHVDLDEFPLVRVTALTPAGTTPTLAESGRPVTDLRAGELGSGKALVLAVDNSRSMRGDPLREAKRAATAFLKEDGHADRTSVVAFGSEAVTLTPGATKAAAVRAVASLTPDGRFGTALYDAVVLSASIAESSSAGTKILVLLTDGRNRRSDASLEEAIEAARQAKVLVYAIAAGSSADTKPLAALASATGGRLLRTGDMTGLASAYRALGRELERTWQLSYASDAYPGEEISLTVRAGKARATTSLRIPLESDVSPFGVLPPSIARSPVTGAAVALLAALLISLAGAVVMRRRRRTEIGRLLERHVAPREAVTETRERASGLAAFLTWTERSLDDLPGGKRLSQTVERSGSPLRRGYLPYLGALAGLVLGLAGTIAGAPPVAGLLLLFAGLAVPFLVLRIAGNRRMKAFDRQLPDVLATVASSLRAGHGLRTALRNIADDGAAPASEELARVLGEERLGRPLDQAITAMCERLNSPDLEYVATAINIQAQTGGSLADLFDTLSETVRERQRHARKVRALTSMGRMSAIFLVCIPFGLGGLMTMLSPAYMAPLFTTSSGHLVIGICLTSMAVGSLFLKKIVSVRY